MIDWVMLPQTVVALYIYNVGRSFPTRNHFTTRNSQGLLNSTRTRGPPVGPVRPTGQTSVAVVGLAIRHSTGYTVEGHRSDPCRQPDQPYANFGCKDEHFFIPPTLCLSISLEPLSLPRTSQIEKQRSCRPLLTEAVSSVLQFYLLHFSCVFSCLGEMKLRLLLFLSIFS
jgi:hypothetical protein